MIIIMIIIVTAHARAKYSQTAGRKQLSNPLPRTKCMNSIVAGRGQDVASRRRMQQTATGGIGKTIKGIFDRGIDHGDDRGEDAQD